MKAPVLALLCWALPTLLHAQSSDASQLIQWLLEEDRQLKGIPFADVVQASSGKKLLPFNRTNAVDRLLLEKIGAALDRVLAQLNSPEHAAQKQKRINEVSSHFERAMRDALNAVPGFSCDYPRTAAGQVQLAGYPDLRLSDQTSGRVVYLDPKLFDQKSRASTLRTFYFEPKKETSKVLDDAHHLIVGFAHDGKAMGHWQFLSWELVDLAHFRVRLKAEFQASNRDLYQEPAVIGTSQARNR